MYFIYSVEVFSNCWIFSGMPILEMLKRSGWKRRSPLWRCQHCRCHYKSIVITYLLYHSYPRQNYHLQRENCDSDVIIIADNDENNADIFFIIVVINILTISIKDSQDHGRTCPNPITRFDHGNFPDYVMNEIRWFEPVFEQLSNCHFSRHAGYDAPTPIQSQGWPLALTGQVNTQTDKPMSKRTNAQANKQTNKQANKLTIKEKKKNKPITSRTWLGSRRQVLARPSDISCLESSTATTNLISRWGSPANKLAK